MNSKEAEVGNVIVRQIASCKWSFSYPAPPIFSLPPALTVVPFIFIIRGYHYATVHFIRFHSADSKGLVGSAPFASMLNISWGKISRELKTDVTDGGWDGEKLMLFYWSNSTNSYCELSLGNRPDGWAIVEKREE